MASMSEILPSFAYQLGLGGIGGFVVGYALKKLSKLVIILIGLFILALLYLGTSGIISINYQALGEAVQGWIGLVSGAASWVIGLVSLLPFMGSFVVGFLLGFKLG